MSKANLFHSQISFRLQDVARKHVSKVYGKANVNTAQLIPSGPHLQPTLRFGSLQIVMSCLIPRGLLLFDPLQANRYRLSPAFPAGCHWRSPDVSASGRTCPICKADRLVQDLTATKDDRYFTVS